MVGSSGGTMVVCLWHMLGGAIKVKASLHMPTMSNQHVDGSA